MLHGFTVDTIVDTLWLVKQTGQVHIVMKSNSAYWFSAGIGYVIRPLNQDVSVEFTDKDLTTALMRIMSYIKDGDLKFLGTYKDLDMESFIAEKAPGDKNIAILQGNRGPFIYETYWPDPNPNFGFEGFINS